MTWIPDVGWWWPLFVFLGHEACRFIAWHNGSRWPTVPSLIVRCLLFTSRWHANLAHRSDDGLKAWRAHRQPIQPANERTPRKRGKVESIRKAVQNG